MTSFGLADTCSVSKQLAPREAALSDERRAARGDAGEGSDAKCGCATPRVHRTSTRSHAEPRASSNSSHAEPRASTAEPLGLEDVSFEQDEEGPPLHSEVGFESDAGADGEVSLTPKPITAQVVGRTDVGLVREHNEDNYLSPTCLRAAATRATFHEVPMAGLLLGVCDGMGGAAAGEVASQMAVDTIFEMMRRSVPASDRDALARALVRAVEEAGTQDLRGCARGSQPTRHGHHLHDRRR